MITDESRRSCSQSPSLEVCAAEATPGCPAIESQRGLATPPADDRTESTEETSRARKRGATSARVSQHEGVYNGRNDLYNWAGQSPLELAKLVRVCHPFARPLDRRASRSVGRRFFFALGYNTAITPRRQRAALAGQITTQTFPACTRRVYLLPLLGHGPYHHSGCACTQNRWKSPCARTYCAMSREFRLQLSDRCLTGQFGRLRIALPRQNRELARCMRAFHTKI